MASQCPGDERPLQCGKTVTQNSIAHDPKRARRRRMRRRKGKRGTVSLRSFPKSLIDEKLFAAARCIPMPRIGGIGFNCVSLERFKARVSGERAFDQVFDV